VSSARRSASARTARASTTAAAAARASSRAVSWSSKVFASASHRSTHALVRASHASTTTRAASRWALHFSRSARETRSSSLTASARSPNAFSTTATRLDTAEKTSAAADSALSDSLCSSARRSTTALRRRISRVFGSYDAVPLGRSTFLCLASWSAKRAMVDNAPRFVVTLGVPARRICDASIVFCASSAKNGILMILSVDTIIYRRRPRSREGVAGR